MRDMENKGQGSGEAIASYQGSQSQSHGGQQDSARDIEFQEIPTQASKKPN
jgi:hypothetical protein